VLFSVVVSGEPEPTVSWYHNGDEVPPENIVAINPCNCLSIHCIEQEHSGRYSMCASNSGGKVTEEFNLKVRKRHSQKELHRINSIRQQEEQRRAEQLEMNTQELHHGAQSFDETVLNELHVELTTNTHSV
jgi:hypothetical protein